MAYFIIDIMRHYDWRQLLLINEPEAQVHVAGKSTCLLMMKTFANYLKKEDIIYTPWDTTSDGGLNYTENLKFYLGYKYTTRAPFGSLTESSQISEFKFSDSMPAAKSSVCSLTLLDFSKDTLT
ncbi:unnamed protein product [Parnassius apollo]|uniref:(apollo) hypothetical protein n=1 Tax=Parnassius apollo TaxID=110799 RepID=A0A8S3XAS6_PARAO|nr:unnamed protein product [Parnassius apollo]